MWRAGTREVCEYALVHVPAHRHTIENRTTPFNFAPVYRRLGSRHASVSSTASAIENMARGYAENSWNDVLGQFPQTPLGAPVRSVHISTGRLSCYSCGIG